MPGVPGRSPAPQLAAGMASPFLPGNFQGQRAGYEYKQGERGKGYYRLHQLAPPTADQAKAATKAAWAAYSSYAAAPDADPFLARLEQAEARDVQQTGGASTSVPFQARYRQHAQQQEQHQQGQRQSEPEWARTNVTEATRAFQRHDPSAYIDRGARPSRDRVGSSTGAR